MSTRAVVIVYDQHAKHELDEIHLDKNFGNRLMCLYHHFNGYPSCLGVKLLEFLQGIKYDPTPIPVPYHELGVDGNASHEVRSIARQEWASTLLGKYHTGMDCLAVQIVRHLKDESGNVYLMPMKYSVPNSDVEYLYEVYMKNNEIWYKGTKRNWYPEGIPEVLFDAPVHEITKEEL